MRARSQGESLGACPLAQAALEKDTAAFDPQPLDVGVSDHAAGHSRSLARTACCQWHRRAAHFGPFEYAVLLAASRRDRQTSPPLNYSEHHLFDIAVAYRRVFHRASER